MSLINSWKKLVQEHNNPITAKKARMIALVGKNCSVEERIHGIIENINTNIQMKMKFSEFYQLVTIPRDILSHKEEIIDDFKNRGFIIYDVKDPNVFIVSWNYEE